jgi:hypothetical protein
VAYDPASNVVDSRNLSIPIAVRPSMGGCFNLVFGRVSQTRTGRVVLRLWRRIRWDSELFYQIAAASQSSSLQVQSAIRWLTTGLVPAGARSALFAHPDSEVKWRVVLPANGRVSAWVGLMPEVWTKNTGGARFTITIETLDGKRLNERHLDVYPGTRPVDRPWRRLTVRGGNRSPVDAFVTLRTSVPGRTNTAYAWAVWGDPQIERRRSLSASIRVLAGDIRERGVLGALRQPAAAALPAEDALVYQNWVAANTQDAPALARLAARTAALPQALRFVWSCRSQHGSRRLRAAIESVRAQSIPTGNCASPTMSPSGRPCDASLNIRGCANQDDAARRERPHCRGVQRRPGPLDRRLHRAARS